VYFAIFVLVKNTKIISSLLSALFIFYALLFCPLATWLQKEAKGEMREKIKDHSMDNDISMLEFNVSEFDHLSWISDNEFISNGILYDLISIDKTADGKYAVKALSDKKEKEIYTTLKNSSDPNTNPAKKSVLLLFKIFAQADFSTSILKMNCFALSSQNNFRYLNHYSFLITELASPPPKTA